MIVTSYCRLGYLKHTVESLRQDDVQLIIVDGGSDEETREYIRKAADQFLLFRGNPGADFLKNAGAFGFVTELEFMVTSDDLIFPKHYSTWSAEQYRRLNRDGLKWTFVACNMDHIDKWPPRPFRSIGGVDILEVDTCQVSGAIINWEVFVKLGGFPSYGRSGQGDWAFSRRIQQLGLRMGYLRRPCLKHLGAKKWEDYPEYSRMFEDDERRWQRAAKADIGADTL